MPASLPVIFLHGYDGTPATFARWHKRLTWLGHDALLPLHYRTDADELDLLDLAEGFDVALRHLPSVARGRAFDVVAHSTGALVVRAWMALDPVRRARVRRFVALAPATFGSPWAHVGRGMLAAGFLGSPEPGPDFLDAGDSLLRDLELGSAMTWSLADADLDGRVGWTGDDAHRGPDTVVFTGVRGFPFPMSIAHPPGSDGVVRHAGVGLHASTIEVDATHASQAARAPSIRSWSSNARPPITLAHLHHGSIAAKPPASLASWVRSFLAASDRDALHAAHTAASRLDTPTDDPYVQLIARVQDDAGRPVRDWYLDLLVADVPMPGGRPDAPKRWRSVLDARGEGGRADVHVVRSDPSTRVFHLPWARFGGGRSLGLRLVARTGTRTVAYLGWHGRFLASSEVWPGVVRPATRESHAATGVLDLGHVQRGPDGLRPGRTTRLSIVVDRAPVPVGGPLPWFRTVDPNG